MGPRSPRRLVVGLLLGAADVEAIAQDSRPALPNPPEGARRHLEGGSTYTVEWRIPVVWGADAEIEVDSGRYDCCMEREPALAWYRLRRLGDHAEILHLETGGGSDSEEALRVRLDRAGIPLADYLELLRDLAWISAARLDRRRTDPGLWSIIGCEAWSYVRLSEGARTAWEDAWAGATSSFDEVRYAKSRACVARVEEAASKAGHVSFVPSPEVRRRILDSLCLRTYAGRPWDAFGGAGRLTDLYRRCVLALGGEPASCLPQPREEVEIVIEGTRSWFEVGDHVTVWAGSGKEVPIPPFPSLGLWRGPRCHAVRLAPGEYTVALDTPEFEPRRFPLTVRRGEPATVELDLVRRETPR
ncbi:MAG: hypothetical protein L0323_15620 [Planctomycetes bacterium]|nr:hypothetical protein [Planctomycetota bacterium]